MADIEKSEDNILSDTGDLEINEILNQAMEDVSNTKNNVLDTSLVKDNLNDKKQNDTMKYYIKTANTDILRNTLAPQTEKNEEKNCGNGYGFNNDFIVCNACMRS